MSIPDPIVLLDARARYAHPAFEMARASTKTVWDSAGRLVTVPPNAIGWDHDPATGQTRGYLAEPSATNLLLHSNDLDQSAWSPVNASITPDAIAGPDGNGMAKLVEDTTTNQHRVFQTFSISSGATVVGQCVVAAAERSAARLLLGDSAVSTDNITITVDCGVGSVLNVGASGNAVVVGHGLVPIGAGLWLVWIAGTVGVEATGARFQVSLSANGNLGYEGDGTSGLYLGYCQAEEGSYPTSYIPTAGSTVTRAGDGLAAPGGYEWWRDDRGALLVECQVPHRHTSGYLISLAGATVQLRWSGDGDLIISSSVLEGSPQILLPTAVLGRHLIAFGWGDDWVVAADGGITASGQMAGAMPSAPAIGVGARSSAGPLSFGGYIRRAVYYPQRIANADLQSLTAIQE